MSLFLASACGDAVLPSDFSGPPAGAVTGNVVAGPTGLSPDARRPRLTMAWLTNLTSSSEASSLFSQPLRFERSRTLQNDWDIGLDLPGHDARLAIAGAGVRVGVGKIVYFDDRVADDRLDWNCRGAACDEVKAVSAQFVVFVEPSLTCRLTGGQVGRPQLGPGYHYFRLDRGVPHEIGAGEAMSFTLSERSLLDSDPTPDLRAFLQGLVRVYAIAGLDGC